MYFFQLCLKLFVSLSIVLLLMILTFKVFGNKVVQINNNRYIKVMEKIQISKDSCIILIKAGEKGYIIGSSSGNIQKIDEVSLEEIKELELQKAQFQYNINEYNGSFINMIKKLKGDKHEV